MSPSAETYEECLASFKAWPHKIPSPEQLARAGFSYSTSPINNDEVECSACALDLHEWSLKDEPIAEHLRESPRCIVALKASKPSLPRRRRSLKVSYINNASDINHC